MPAARNQEVTVRRPLAKRRPTSSPGRRAAERLCSQWASAAKALVRNGGKCENGMAGSLTRDSLRQSHRGQGVGLCPPPRAIHCSVPPSALPLFTTYVGGKSLTSLRKVQSEGVPADLRGGQVRHGSPADQRPGG